MRYDIILSKGTTFPTRLNVRPGMTDQLEHPRCLINFYRAPCGQPWVQSVFRRRAKTLLSLILVRWAHMQSCRRCCVMLLSYGMYITTTSIMLVLNLRNTDDLISRCMYQGQWQYNAKRNKTTVTSNSVQLSPGPSCSKRR